VSFASLSAGAIHTCGTTAAAQAYCWGNNNWSQLGSTSAETCSFSSPCSTAPKLIDSGPTFRSVTAGWQHTCGLTLTGEAYCWGANSRGELGTGAPVGFPVTSYPTPVAVAGGLTFARLSASESHTCGITTAGHAYCWGDNQYAQLGDGTTSSSHVPVPVRGGITFRTD
jgi:alpha-tubulin suppressor-like RCC1 family protein